MAENYRAIDWQKMDDGNWTGIHKRTGIIAGRLVFGEDDLEFPNSWWFEATRGVMLGPESLCDFWRKIVELEEDS